MKYLAVSPNALAMVDDEDYEDVAQFSWHISGAGYVQRSYRLEGRRLCEWLHRRVMQTPADKEVHHIDKDKLNCQKTNLVNLSAFQHGRYYTYSPGNKTGYRGVTLHPKTGRYNAAIKIAGVLVSLGYYDTAKEAGEVYASFRYQNARGVEAHKL